MSDLVKNNFEIDAVILWVDGNDINHKNKLIKYLDDPTLLNKRIITNRYNQVNEIEYTVKSILKFASFIRKIYIVTDEQTPDFLNSNSCELYKKIEIIDHKIIFRGFENYLPVFNSNAIETMVSRIPNLSERYICFNDDTILIKHTKPSDFFDSNGIPVIRGKIMSFETNKIHKKIVTKLGLKKIKTKGYLGYNRKQDYFFKLMGETKKICVNHTPFTFRKSTMLNFFSKNPDIFTNNIQYKFRNEHNVLTQSISAFEEVNKNSALLKENYQLIQLDSPKKKLFFIKLKLYLGNKNPQKIFLNVQSLDLYSTSKFNYLKKWLENLCV